MRRWVDLLDDTLGVERGRWEDVWFCWATLRRGAEVGTAAGPGGDTRTITRPTGCADLEPGGLAGEVVCTPAQGSDQLLHDLARCVAEGDPVQER